MITLAIDTSAHLCAAALHDSDTDTIVAERTQDIGRGHAERLMDMIGEVLAEAVIGYEDVNRVAVSVGPGSFTGVRVGLAAARGIALGLGVPVVGICALDALRMVAEPQMKPETSLLVALDARRGEAYAQFFGSDVFPQTPFVASYEAIAAIVPDSVDIRICGSGARRVIEAAGRDLPIVHELAAAPIAAYGRLGATALDTDTRPEPLYLRPPDAKPQSGFALARA